MEIDPFFKHILILEEFSDVQRRSCHRLTEYGARVLLWACGLPYIYPSYHADH